MAFRHYSNSPIIYGDNPLPIECTRNIAPYGTSYVEPQPSVLLNNAELYKLENLLDKPDLLKPLNPTVLAPSDYDTAIAVQKVNQFMSNNN